MNRKIRITFLVISTPLVLFTASCTGLQTLPIEKPASRSEPVSKGEPAKKGGAASKGEPANRAEKVFRDPFSRVYAVPFKDFHPKLNDALQKLAREKTGNAFQVTLLGSSQVSFRGTLRERSEGTPFSVSLVTKAVNSGKTRLEITPISNAWGAASEEREAVSRLFRFLETETGFKPIE